MVTKRDIIKYLNNTNGELITSKQIASHFSVTQRTIQNYLKEIKEEFQDCLETGQKGIKVVKQMEIKEDHTIPLTFEERKSYILRKLLVSQQAIAIEQLAQDLCISEITLQNEIKKIRRTLETYGLSMKTKNDHIFIVGSIKDKKALMIKLIYGEAENSLVSLSTLNDIFQNYDAEKIRDILLQKLNAVHFFMDEYSLINLLLHILIAMDQSQSLQTIHHEDMSQEFIDLNHHFVSIIDGVCESLEALYHVKFTSSNRYQFTLLLMTRAIRNKEIKGIDRTKLSVSDEILSLVHYIIDEIYRIYDIDLNTNEFVIAFSLHIKNMLIRLKEQISLHNPLLFNIKSTSPFIYDIAVHISNIIHKMQHVEVYDDEIAYIALHIGARIEEINSTRDKLKAVLVCPQYYSYANQQFKKIETYFHDDMLLSSIVTNPVDFNTSKCDIILSTIPLSCTHNTVFISNFFNETDKERITTMIKHIKRSKAKDKTIDLLKKLIDKRLFTIDANFSDKEDAIRSMADRLIAKGFVGEEFIEKVLDRENISSTNFGMLAVPHPIDYYAKKTVIEIAILKRPVSWGTSSVKIIFMFCINQRDFSSFSDVFSFLAGTCSDDSNLECLVASKSYEAFMKNIIDLYQ